MRVNEIFYSLQGEGRYTGVPAVFVRFSRCNLKCWFCDTDHIKARQMTEVDILNAIKVYPAKHVILTGGEPTLQITSRLTDILHENGYYIQIETNGTIELKDGVDIDWITCSPKSDNPINLKHVDEIKVVLDREYMDLSRFEAVEAKEYRLQPCDVKDPQKNAEILKRTIDYILKHPKWSLSLQTHKLINIQ